MATLLVGACAADGMDGEETNASSAQLRADDIVRQIEEAAPSAGDPARLGVAINASTRTLHAGGERLAAELPMSSAGMLEVTRPAGVRVALALPLSGGDRPAVMASDGTVTYQEALPGTDLAVEVFEGGVRFSTVVNDASAPSALHYAFELPEGARMVAGDAGSAMILDADQAPLGGIEAPVAFDAQHRAVATHIEIQDGELVQVIEHAASTVYPVITSYYLGFDLIASASWIHRSQGWTLSVDPTGWLRTNCGGYVPGSAAWDELYSKYKNHGLNTNLGGMRDQLICHVQIACFKDRFNLDEWRPDVSYPATVAALCNPGGGND
jgi:hypothetical protein